MCWLAAPVRRWWRWPVRPLWPGREARPGIASLVAGVLIAYCLRSERKLDPDMGAVPMFAAELRKLRQQAGNPTYRELAVDAHYSLAAAGGRKLPSLAVTLAYARACGGDERVWRLVGGKQPRPQPWQTGRRPNRRPTSDWPRSSRGTPIGSSAGSIWWRSW